LEFKREGFNSRSAQSQIQNLKREIARLGDVNMLAISDLAETEERLATLTAERDDIQAGYDDLKKIIADLTNEMVIKFTDAFNKINQNFQEIFRKLFDGGKGELRLEPVENDPDGKEIDPLEAGIEIFAQPPGKKLQHISLLSGGEKALTAISILFGILQLKPMPFCVLDEIEAALDDANANLFSELLKMFAEKTQFIVITHRKPTMRHADTIYGVTMEEKGVTKIVRVEFEEALKHIQTQSA
jgi:chromosome segregation protein